MDIGNEHSLVDPEDATTRDTDEEEDEDMGGLMYLVGRMTSVEEVREYRLDYDPLGHLQESETSAMESTAEKTRFEMEMAPHPGTSNMETADDDQERSQAIEERRGGQQGCVLRRSGIMVANLAPSQHIEQAAGPTI
ncbi:hypothetical protein CTAM01_11428 [Colletotrichum tamarilloi]|uniref:Uncharacterized protein n=1 Tax=Colletotrichum tamarilloi TaxID=1209934 RepID=A0ABQ9QXQ8_9PEZI|nr:uncharacterized protein CTAM01_11428 [Colletotrichum tamarilloi]KAK1488205.1 hypothetical protein CTAM01_11428 [Colletotrichum tamarilloi]